LFCKRFLGFNIFNLQIGQQSGARKTVVKKATGGAQQAWVSRPPIEAISISREMSAKERDFSPCFLS
jgi:hypothetical protein